MVIRVRRCLITLDRSASSQCGVIDNYLGNRRQPRTEAAADCCSVLRLGWLASPTTCVIMVIPN
jgi:hypothetical protein